MSGWTAATQWSHLLDCGKQSMAPLSAAQAERSELAQKPLESGSGRSTRLDSRTSEAARCRVTRHEINEDHRRIAGIGPAHASNSSLNMSMHRSTMATLGGGNGLGTHWAPMHLIWPVASSTQTRVLATRTLMALEIDDRPGNNVVLQKQRQNDRQNTIS